MTKEHMIEEWNDSYKTVLKMDILPIDELHTNTINMIHAFIGINPSSPMYGHITGFFEYNNKIYRFKFHIHTPKQKYPWLSNQMTNIDEVCVVQKHGEEFIQYNETEFGRMASWVYTSLNYLKEKDTESYELRKLINNIVAYSRKNDFCKQLRKTDKTAMNINPYYKQS